MGIRAAIQFTSITSTKHRAHTQVSSSDHCERTILLQFPSSPKGQINEECLLRNVESWESLSLADTSDLVLGRALVADAAVWQASRNLFATSYQESCCLFRFENEPSIKQLLPCWKNNNLPSFNILPVLPVDGAFVQQSSSHQSPVPNIEHTCRCQTVTTAKEAFSPPCSSSLKGQIDEECLLRNVESWESLSLADTSDLVLGRVFGCWCCCVTGIPGILLLPATRNHVAFSGSRMSRASNNFCHAGRTKTCPRSISCQSCSFNGHSCSNPVHIDHQHQT